MKKTLLEWIKDWSNNRRSFAVKGLAPGSIVEFNETGMCFKRSMHGLNLSIEWELVQQPIPFLEAVKAYSEGKTIRCEWGNGLRSVYKNGTMVKALIEITFGVKIPICPKEILQGVWYMEDDNE